MTEIIATPEVALTSSGSEIIAQPEPSSSVKPRPSRPSGGQRVGPRRDLDNSDK